jgi:hypothetical protein
MISVPKVPVARLCFSRAPTPPPSQVIDYGWSSVPSKISEFTDENSDEELNLASEFARNSCRKNDIFQ